MATKSAFRGSGWPATADKEYRTTDCTFQPCGACKTAFLKRFNRGLQEQLVDRQAVNELNKRVYLYARELFALESCRREWTWAAGIRTAAVQRPIPSCPYC